MASTEQIEPAEKIRVFCSECYAEGTIDATDSFICPKCGAQMDNLDDPEC